MTLKLYQKPALIDILDVCNRMPDDEREQYEAFTGEKYDYQKAAIEFASRTGPSWLLCDNERPICIAGFDYYRPGVWQDWMVSTAEAWSAANWRGTTRHVRKAMNAMLNGHAHRLQCVSLRSRIQAHEWYRVLGLRQEGILAGYGANGEDALMFARVKE